MKAKTHRPASRPAPKKAAPVRRKYPTRADVLNSMKPAERKQYARFAGRFDAAMAKIPPEKPTGDRRPFFDKDGFPA